MQPDLVTLGKSVAGGTPFGAYGMTAALAAVFERPDPADTHAEIATGGTFFANALSMAAARAALGEVLTGEVYERTARLGTELADGIEAAAQQAGLPWRAHRLFPRSGYAHGGELPQNAEDARRGFRRDVTDLQRVYFANRGVWEAIYSAGPCVGIAHTEARRQPLPGGSRRLRRRPGGLARSSAGGAYNVLAGRLCSILLGWYATVQPAAAQSERSALGRETRGQLSAAGRLPPLRIVSRIVSYVLPSSRAAVIAGTNMAS